MKKEYSVTIDGELIHFEFKDSLMHCQGDDAGNIDAIITTKPPLPQNKLLDELYIKVPGNNEYLYIYSYGVVEDSLKVTFNSSKHVDIEQPPESVEVYWGEEDATFIGEMSCLAFSKEVESSIAAEVEEVDEPSNVDDETYNDTVDDKNDAAQQKSELNSSKQQRYIYIGIVLLLMLVGFIFLA